MAKVPQIRFKGFEGEWEKNVLHDVASFSKGHGYSKSDLVEKGSPIVLYGRLYTKYELGISEVDTFVSPQDGSVVSRGNEIVIPASGESAEDIAIASVIEKPGIILGGDLNILSLKTKSLLPHFIALTVSTGDSHRALSNVAQGKTVVHLHNDEIAKVNFLHPCFDEQKEIASYFSSFDTLISSRQKELQKLKAIKNALLEQMFPKDGETNPKVRFKGFEGDWKRSKLGEIFDERDERSGDGDMISVTTKDGIKKASEIERFVSFGNLSKYKVVKEGDIAYNTMRMWQGACGYSPYSGILSPAYTVLSPRDGHNSKFYACLFKNNDVIHKFYLNSQGLTSDNWNLKYEAFSEIVIQTTKDEVEQAKIAAIFSHLDRLITARTAQLTKLQNLKRGMLERMFVNE